MSEPFLGMILLLPYNFAPRGYAFCQGQILPIAQNTALFSLIGTTYGGNGQTTFALPDLRGRAPIGSGQGPGLSNYDLGEEAGTESVTLTLSNLPAHSHTVSGTSTATSKNPSNNLPAAFGTVAWGSSPDLTLNPLMISSVGGSQPFDILQPYLTLNYCIALEGIFPSRN